MPEKATPRSTDPAVASSTKEKPSGDFPKSLTILAQTLIAVGGLAVIETFRSFLRASVPSINFLVIFVLIGFGLLRRQPMSRSLAFYTAGGVFVFYLMSIIYRVFGPNAQVDQLSGFFFWLTSVSATVVSGWAVYTLNRPSVVRLFND